MSTSTDSPVIADVGDDDVVPDYVCVRAFRFGKSQFSHGDPITVAVYRHRRFETLIRSGFIKAVRR